MYLAVGFGQLLALFHLFACVKSSRGSRGQSMAQSTFSGKNPSLTRKLQGLSRRSHQGKTLCGLFPPRSFLLLPILIAALLLSCVALAQSPSPQQKPEVHARIPALDDPAINRKVDALLSRMTLEEKIGQLVQYSVGQPSGPGTGRTGDDDMIRNGEVGSLFNVTTAARVNAFQKIAVEDSPLHIPLLFGLDVIHGFRTTFPIPLALASTWDPALVQQTARIAAREASAAGVRWTFSPMVDIARDARWGRMTEGAGEDPFLGSAMARAYVLGYQSDRLDAPDSIAACVKHFVGYGATEGGRDYNSAEISEHTLRQFYLPPFHAAVEAGAVTVMSAFNSLDAVPASANPFTLTEILRKEWGFRGFVVSDWDSISELINHGIANDGATAAKKAFLAGVDMDMVSNLYHENLLNLVRSGLVSQAAIDESARRILRVKFALGLFDQPYVDESKESSAMLRPESLALARKAAEQSFVLLKNSPVNNHALLPLSPKLGSVALIGPLADNAGEMLGSWAGNGHPEDAITLKTSLEQKLGADHVHYARGSGFLHATDSEIAAAVEAAKQSDLVILTLGEDAPTMTGEAASRAHLGLPGRQGELFEQIVATGKPVVLILFSGRPLTLPWAFEHVPAVLAAWFPGVQAGPALVDILVGDANPSGRLPVSWPRAVGQEPLYYDALSTGRPADGIDLSHPPRTHDEKYVSRYIDEPNSPQFPFGFGLSYTTFSYGPVQLSASQLSAAQLASELHAHSTDKSHEDALTVSADVTNTGTRPGDEVVQLYVRLQGTSVALPVRALKGFQRISLAPGETRKVTFHLGPDAFAFWNIHNIFTVEPARATIWIAPDSAHGQSASLTLTGNPN
jgi:beta-glucosidase